MMPVNGVIIAGVALFPFPYSFPDNDQGIRQGADDFPDFPSHPSLEKSRDASGTPVGGSLRRRSWIGFDEV
jgi:hypothetical protein